MWSPINVIIIFPRMSASLVYSCVVPHKCNNYISPGCPQVWCIRVWSPINVIIIFPEDVRKFGVFVCGK